MISNLLMSVIGIVIFLAWSWGLISLAQSRRHRKVHFYLLLFIVPILSFIYVFLTGGLLILLATLPLGILWLALLTLYIGFWAVTVREVASRDKLVWFYLILLINPLWILYRLTEAF